MARACGPTREDYFVLKPKHSASTRPASSLLLDHLRARTLILTGLLADMCILFTAHDAYMRGYDVLVPADCVAARVRRIVSRALDQMRRVLEADTRPSTALDLAWGSRASRALRCQ